MNRTKIFAILIGTFLASLPVRGQENVEEIVAQNIRPILPANGEGGGVAVAVRINSETRFFNYGFANDARNERVTEDSIFNLGSVGKLFATTTLAEAVKRGELSLDDPVAKYVTELQRGGDVRRNRPVLAARRCGLRCRFLGPLRRRLRPKIGHIP